MNKYVEAEVLNHRMLRHPHVIEFKEVLLTPEYLCIAMEYASGALAPLCHPPPPPLRAAHAADPAEPPPAPGSQQQGRPARLRALGAAAGGNLFSYVQRAVRLKEPAARWFFQQLVIGLDYCHRKVRSSGAPRHLCTLVCCLRGPQHALSRDGAPARHRVGRWVAAVVLWPR